MNQEQEAHVKALAEKIKARAEIMASRMSTLVETDLSNVNLHLAQGKFTDALVCCQEVQSVYADMWPKLPVE